MQSPVGPLLLVADRSGLRRLHFAARSRRAELPPADAVEDAEALAPVVRQLEEYFAGERRTFDLSLAPGGTPFQAQVWTELCRIPYGETISYLQLAQRIDNPRAVRAVGLANGSNPIAIVIPCHRVIGANGSLTGYGGGLPTKRWLLGLESGGEARGAAAAPQQTALFDR
jgi:methylated-DNA-[protein]-cysteine S-methyltransferase